ncbi:helix-turn-helix domain-containing protein [Paracoccus sp. DK608]|uniref:Helix-turn-helix domain-containing protein n=2 Tax=Paracoccus shanxieyensis TaxID=2675752 RepID=A0A6L6IYI0_9RHOB|nr:helix-turn-helix domain-containing protein [Paracoccus shanxieyensis]MTH88639.1 helix-turn-helix domain-containing protein [Paracoccus shanxieyensis]
MERRMISAGFVQDALAAVGQLDAAALLARAGIADAGQPVSHLQYGRLWLAIAQDTGCEFFGQGARQMRPGSFALMGHAVLHAETLDRALRRALRFMDMAIVAPSGRLLLRDGMAEIVLRDDGPQDDGPPRAAFAYRTYWLILLGLMCWLIGRRIALARVDFACQAPPNRQDYRQFFGAPVQFGQPHSRLVFAADYLSLPLIRSERALKAFLRGAPANILLRYPHDQGLSGRIRARLRAVPPEQWPDFDSLARDLGQSPATLRRRLRAEGQGFAAIRAEMRHAMACRLLRDTKAPIAAIAARLGYAEPGAFHRAFLKLAGMTPATFRRGA